MRCVQTNRFNIKKILFEYFLKITECMIHTRNHPFLIFSRYLVSFDVKFFRQLYPIDKDRNV